MVSIFYLWIKNFFFETLKAEILRLIVVLRSFKQFRSAKKMEGTPLTSETVALAEKKMDMTLDDIIKMSKSKTAKPRRQRVSNRKQKFVNNVSQDKSSEVRRFMDSKSSLRQGVLAKRRSNFQGNHFSLATEAAISPIRGRTFPRGRSVNINNVSQDKSSKVRRFMDSKSSLRQGVLAQRRSNFQGSHFSLATEDAISPIHVRTFPRGKAVNINKLRVGVLPVQRSATNAGPMTKQQQHQQQPPHQPTNVSKRKPQTLDSLFANMKEQRTRFLSQQNNGSRRSAAGEQRMRVLSQQNDGRRWSAAAQQRPQWGRGRFDN